jgi:hypothetical protein
VFITLKQNNLLYWAVVKASGYAYLKHLKVGSGRSLTSKILTEIGRIWLRPARANISKDSIFKIME